MLELKKPKSSCLKWEDGRPGIDYRVATDGRTHPKCRKTSFLKMYVSDQKESSQSF